MEKTHKSFQQNRLKLTTIKEEERINIKQEQELEDNNFDDKLMQLKVDIKELREHKEAVEKNPLENEQLHSDRNDEDLSNESSSASDEYEPSVNSEFEDITNEKLENIVKRKDVQGNIKRNFSDKTEQNVDVPKKKRSSHRLDPVLTEQLIKKHIPMLCDLCVFTGNSFADIAGHFKEHHSKVQPYIMCCNRKFTRSYCIDQHAIIHENPDSFR